MPPALNMSVKSRIGAGVFGVAIALASVIVVGFEGRRLHAYQDTGGVWTLCDGHTRGVKRDDIATPGQCDEYLSADLLEANAVVDSCITAPMTTNQRAAFISFAFNVGPGRAGVKDGLCVLKNGKQPFVRRMANDGRWKDACEGLLLWARAGTEKLRGLARRRAAELAMCWPNFANVIG